MQCLSVVVFARNAIDIMLTHDQDDNSSLLLDHIQLLAIFTFPLQGGAAQLPLSVPPQNCKRASSEQTALRVQ